MNTFTKAFLPLIFAALSSCLKDKPVKKDYQGFQPVIRNDGWTISRVYRENMDSSLVDHAFRLLYNDKRYIMARSLLVIRNGKLVAEAYPHDVNDIDRIANVQSITKSFTSILTGMAIRQKLIDSVNQPLSSIYPEFFASRPEKTGITIKHALTMTTGIDFENGEHTEELYAREGNTVDFVLSRPQKYSPGVVFHYHDGAPQLVSAAIQKKAGMPFSEFGNTHLFKPLGITDWKWETAKDGNTFGAFSLFLKPRDLARFGQLLLQEGNWNGTQLVDSAWISEAVQAHVNSGEGGGPYGYYFWIYPAYNSYAAIGHGGQHIMVFPDKDLVLVYTAWGYTSGEYFDSFNEMADLLYASCH